MYPTWLLVVAVVIGGVRGTTNQCWEHPSCQDLDSENSVMACLQLCRYELTDHTPVVPGDAPHSPAKRSYSMEHFRWGKPVGLKRRPIKTFSSLGVAEKFAQVFPGVMRRKMDNQVPAIQLLLGQEEQDGIPQGNHQRRPPEWVVTDDTSTNEQPGGYMKIARALQERRQLRRTDN